MQVSLSVRLVSAHVICYGFRRTLAANLRQQVAAMMELEAAEKPKMPTYGSSVRFVPISHCLKAATSAFLSFE